MKLKDVDLKPCPYCGGKAELKTKHRKIYSVVSKYLKGTTQNFYVKCSKCNVKFLHFLKQLLNGTIREFYLIRTNERHSNIQI